MNLRQPYEQLIADKLRQLRAPDADASWQQMKRLLDDDEDRGAGGGKRPPGNNGWWRIGIIVIALSAGLLFFVDKNPSPGSALAKNSTEASPHAVAANNAADSKTNSTTTQKATIDNNTTLNDLTTSATVNSNTETGTANTDKAVAAASVNNPAATIKNNTSKVTVQPVAGNTADDLSGETAAIANATGIKTFAYNTTHNTKNKNQLHKNKESADATVVESSSSIINKNSINNSANQKNIAGILKADKKQNGSNYQSAGGGIAGTPNATADLIAGADVEKNQDWAPGAPGQYERNVQTGRGKTTIVNTTEAYNNFATAGNNKSTGYNFSPDRQTATSKEKNWFARLTELKINTPVSGYNTSLLAADSLAGNRDLALNNETKKTIAKTQRDKAIALLDKKDKKLLHLDLSNLFKPFSMRPLEVEPWWAAGLAINSGITLNAQSRFNRNINAKSSIISDYIPSPYLQYHLNNYVYLQTELNFITPQYTPQLLVYRQNSEVTATGGGTGGISQQKSIYIQKLYYFNWPVSLHYSPVSNLYFSAGLQFSSFQSGLAAIEAKQYPSALGPDHSSGTSTTVLKFKDDSIAARIAPNEWRWQLGAEYYLNRFAIGLRYNQSFKNAINTTVSASLPPTVNRNQSLLFFVRYNLFESRTKNSNSKN